MLKLVRSVFPLLIVLRLCDQQEPFMDKLYFYVRRMDSTLIKSKVIMDEVEKEFQGTSWRAIYESKPHDDSSDEDTDSHESEYDSETCAEEDSDTMPSLGQKVIDIWNKRRNKLVNDFTVAAWLLSPIPDVYQDSITNSTGDHRMAVDRLLKKMFASSLADDSDELATLFNDFWEEFEHFKSKTGPFDKAYIWKANNPDLFNGRSYMWHKKNSLPFTKILGKFACRVCSKIVGMGSAERNWGDVKHLKTDKRSHLSSDAVQKQATIFGASCMLNARLDRNSKTGSFDDPYKFWNDEDFDKEFTSFSIPTKQSCNSNARVFKCYLEDWEKDNLHRKDDVSKAKFLQKYGGLEFDDVDDPVHYWILSEDLHFQRRSKHEPGGWCVLVKSDQSIDEGKDNDESHSTATGIQMSNKKTNQKWSIFDDCALIDCIASYYMRHPLENVKLVMRKGQAEEIRSLTACGGCDKYATPHHKCDKCKKSMHISCGRLIGEIKVRSIVRCPRCDNKKGITKPDDHKKVSSIQEDKSALRVAGQSATGSDSPAAMEPVTTKDYTVCGGCGREAGPVHKCDMCSRHMHPFCGRTIGEEGYGAHVRCPACDKKR